MEVFPQIGKWPEGSQPLGGDGDDMWGDMRGENKVDTGGDVRMYEMRHRRGHGSRYRRRHMEGDIVGDGAEDGSWREALCAGEVL